MLFKLVGRTARGNSSGHAITMLKIGQMSLFKRMHSQFQPSVVPKTDDMLTNNTDTDNIQMLLKTKTKQTIENIVLSEYKKALKLLSLVLDDKNNRFSTK